MNNGRWRSFSTPRVTRSRAPRALGVRYPRGGVRLLGLSYLLARLRLVEEVPVALDPLPSVRASRHYFGVAPTNSHFIFRVGVEATFFLQNATPTRSEGRGYSHFCVSSTPTWE